MDIGLRQCGYELFGDAAGLDDVRGNTVANEQIGRSCKPGEFGYGQDDIAAFDDLDFCPAGFCVHDVPAQLAVFAQIFVQTAYIQRNKTVRPFVEQFCGCADDPRIARGGGKADQYVLFCVLVSSHIRI